MKKLIISFVLLSFFFVDVKAQDQDTTRVNPYMKKEKPRKALDKMYFGGTFGLSFGTYTSIGVYPLFGYKITPKLSAGLELGYQYLENKYYTPTISSSNYGASIFTRYRLIPAIYLHAEFKYFNYEIHYPVDNNTSRQFVPFLCLGAGFSQRVGCSSWIYAQILFDVLNDPNSPFRSGKPFYSVGVCAGF